jgi:hypothetical protein
MADIRIAWFCGPVRGWRNDWPIAHGNARCLSGDIEGQDNAFLNIATKASSG